MIAGKNFDSDTSELLPNVDPEDLLTIRTLSTNGG
jgi:hypothetical protein